MTASDVARPERDTGRIVAGRYRLDAKIGRGGMGVVWSARDELLGRPVAVKEVRLPASIDDDERAVLRERTLREARTAARLDHPCAVRVFDVCEEDEQAYIVMELIAGRTLSEVIRDDGPVSPAQAAEIGACILDALVRAHEAGIVHRDVKPGNVIVRPDGRVTLTDFGIASTAGDPSLTSTGLLLGSPAYIAPERARGGAPEPASDLWSLGATIYTAVEGRPPYDKPDPVATLAAVVTDDPTPCMRAGPLAPVLVRMLAKDPEERPEPVEVRAALRAIAADPAAQVAAAAPAPPPPSRTSTHTVALPPAVSGREPALRARVLAWALMCALLFTAAAGVAAVVRSG